MGRYDEDHARAIGWIVRHEMRDRPSRSFWFSEPGKGSIYAFALTWSPGTLALSGDLGELVLTHYQAMPTLESAVAWAARADADYLLGKSNRKKSICREGTVEGIIEGAIQSQYIRERLEDHFTIGRAWGAGLKALLKREVPHAVRDVSDASLPQFIADLHHFDDWYGSYRWTAHDIYQVAAVQFGCQAILATLAKAEAA